MTGKIAVIAALEGEIAPLVKGWSSRKIQAGKRDIRIFESDAAIVACGGVGGNPARAATDATYRDAGGKIAEFISAGFAGALVSGLKVGDIFRPAKVIGDSDNNMIEMHSGEGILVSAGAIAGVEHKRIFANKYGAQAIDMEAFSVADVARIYNVPCRAVKAISDEYDFALPPMGRFVQDDGSFDTASFVAYSLVRPRTWKSVLDLRRNSGRAGSSLCMELQQIIEASS